MTIVTIVTKELDEKMTIIVDRLFGGKLLQSPKKTRKRLVRFALRIRTKIYV